MGKSFLAGLAALVLSISSCASLPEQYQKQTGKSVTGHSEMIDYAGWCTEKGYWEEAVRCLQKAEKEAVSDQEKCQLYRELAKNHYLMADWDYRFLFGFADEARDHCQSARSWSYLLMEKCYDEKSSEILDGLDFLCDLVEGNSSPSLR